MEIAITHIDTACILLEINGFKILTDPTLDQAGGLYSHTRGTSAKQKRPIIISSSFGTDSKTIQSLNLGLSFYGRIRK